MRTGKLSDNSCDKTCRRVRVLNRAKKRGIMHRLLAPLSVCPSVSFENQGFG